MKRKIINTDWIVQVAKKCNNSCMKCGSIIGLEIHHVKPLAKGGKDIPENTILLCDLCHKFVHKNKNEIEFYNENKYYSKEELSYIDSSNYEQQEVNWQIKLRTDSTDHFEILCPKCNGLSSIERIFIRDYSSLVTPPCWYILLKCHHCKIKGQRKMYLNEFKMEKTLE